MLIVRFFAFRLENGTRVPNSMAESGKLVIRIMKKSQLNLGVI